MMGMFMAGSEHMINMSGEVRSWMDHMCWTTGGEVCRVRIRARRFVEVGPRAYKFVEACYILGPWSLENLRAVRFLGKVLTKIK